MAQFPIESRFRPVDPVLQGIVSGIANDPGKFMAQRILPSVSTGGESSGTIMTLADTDLFGDPDAKYERALGATAHEISGVKLGNTTYRVQEYAAMVPADLKQLSRSQLPQQVELKSLLLARLMHDLLIAQERRMSTLFSSSTTWTNNTDPTTSWNAAGSDPLADINTAVESVAANGVDANTAIIGRGARQSLQTNDTFLEFLPLNSDRGFIEADAVKARISSLFGIPVERIFYVDGRYNSASQGQSASLTNIMDDEMWIGHISTQSVPFGGGVTLQPTAAARFVEQEFMVEEWDDPARNSVWQKVCHSEQMLQITAGLGHLIYNINA